MSRHPAQNEEIGQHIDHVDGLQLARHPDRQALMRELVQDVKHAILPSIMRAVLDEVVGPHVIAMLGPQAMHEPSVNHRRPRFGCFWGTFSPSRRQIRSTRLSLTSQPASRSKAAIFR